MPKKQERQRLSVLHSLHLLDTLPEVEVDYFTQLASFICKTPIALVSLVDEDRQWFKSKIGLEATETPREYAFCDHAIKNDGLFIVKDALNDTRFKDNPLATDSPHVIFYAGVPLKFDGHNVGTLCVVDNKPRDLTEDQKQQLLLLSKQLISFINLRRKAFVQKKISKMLSSLNEFKMSPSHDLSEDIKKMLKAGVELYNLEYAIQSKIVGNEYIVEAALSPQDELAIGSVFELEQTYCAAVVQKQETVTYKEVRLEESLQGHPVYINMQLESYISTPIWLDGQLYGTLNFSSKNVKKTGFTEDEVMFIEIMADLISKKIKYNEKQMLLSYVYEVINESPDLIAIGDIKSKQTLYSNKAFEKMLGKKPSYFQMDEFFTAESRRKIQEEGIPFVGEGKIWKEEVEFIDYKQRIIPMQQTLVGHKDERGQLVYLSVILQDLTKQKEIEKNHKRAKEAALMASKMKTEFLANMSHEIRTPMNGVLGLLTLLKDTSLDTDQLKLIKTIESCGESLLSLLNDVLDLSKIESQKLKLDITEFDLKQIISDVTELFSFRAIEKNITLKVELDKDLSRRYRGDPTRIKQILTNFISNALKFTYSGEIVVKVLKHKSKLKKSIIDISVQDSGVGISKENQKKIFQAFTQADTSVTRNFGGTGLGLSISKKLATLMHGEILLESTEGMGSTFTFRVPLKESHTQSLENNNLDLVIDKEFAKNNPQKILIVEDNLLNQKLAKKFLAKLGYEADLANSGVEALEMTRKTDYTVIFMDMQMPHMDGLETTKRIKEEIQSEAKIIAMTANVYEENKQKCFKAGMVGFVTKPFKPKDFAEALLSVEELGPKKDIA